MSRLVVIVGRPNVGKSTLFNRLTRQQQAITVPQAGSTRDRQYGKVPCNNTYFTLVDTGGYLDYESDRWSPLIREQVHMALEQARLVLLVGDCQVGCTSEDLALGSMLRATGTPLMVVANKADNEKVALQAAELYSLGIKGEVYAVSAAHGRGIKALKAAIVNELGLAISEAPNDEDDVEGAVVEGAADVVDVPSFAIIGRPNMGKSSLLNLLLDSNRSLVTEEPGTTRDSLEVSFSRFGKNIRLIDTAGVRKRTRIHEDVEFYSVLRTMRAIEACDVALILIDASMGLERQDLNLLNMAYDLGKGMVLLVNKWDLIEKNTHTAKAWDKELTSQMGTLAHVPKVYCSVHAKQRILKTLEVGLLVHQQRQQRIGTGRLNEWLQEHLRKRPAPAIRGRPLKINYATQTKESYPQFILFGNTAEVPLAYQRFLIKRLRKDFGLEGVRVDMDFRKKN